MADRRGTSFSPVTVLACALVLSGCAAGGSVDSSNEAQLPPPATRPGLAPNEDTRTVDDPVSTFALDVDTASYDYARRLLGEGRLPEPETVRVEEFVNAFRQDYPQPPGNGFTVTIDGAVGGLGVPIGYGADAAYQAFEGDTRLVRVTCRRGRPTRSADRWR